MNSTQQISHIARLTRENAELRHQLQSLVFAAYLPLHWEPFEGETTSHKILKNEIESSEALLESI